MLGIGLGIVYRGGGSTGGLATIGQMIKKYSGLSSGYSQLLADGCVVIVSVFVFDMEIALIAMMDIFVFCKVIDFVQLQSSDSKLILIFTYTDIEMNSFIKVEINLDIKKLKKIGGYSNA